MMPEIINARTMPDMNAWLAFSMIMPASAGLMACICWAARCAPCMLLRAASRSGGDEDKAAPSVSLIPEM